MVYYLLIYINQIKINDQSSKFSNLNTFLVMVCHIMFVEIFSDIIESTDTQLRFGKRH